jgi:ADP-ribose pyrophosphatase
MLSIRSTRIAFENPWVRLREDAVRFPDGRDSVYAFIERPRYAVIAAIEAGMLWMVEQYRHPLKARSWELPMGVAPGGDAIPIAEAAEIELREETGVTAAHWQQIAELAPAPALLAQTGVLFLATGLTNGPQALEETEQDLVATAMPVETVLGMVRDGTIRDAATLASLGLLRLYGHL